MADDGGWCDTHVHLWDLSKFDLPWTLGAGKLEASHLLADYERASASCDIRHAVYMEVDVEPSQRQAEIDYVSELCPPPAPSVSSPGRPASFAYSAVNQ